MDDAQEVSAISRVGQRVALGLHIDAGRVTLCVRASVLVRVFCMCVWCVVLWEGASGWWQNEDKTTSKLNKWLHGQLTNKDLLSSAIKQFLNQQSFLPK